MTMMRPLNLDKTTLSGFDRLARHMSHHADRQRVIASNVANIDTPGYRARDLAFEEVLNVDVSVDGVDRTMNWTQELVTMDDEVPDQDGNTVSLEMQMAKMASNMLRFRSISELLSRRIGMVRFAAGDGK